MAQALRRAGRVLCGHDLWGGGDWAVTLALARGFSLQAGTLVVAPDNLRLQSIALHGAHEVAVYWGDGDAGGWAATNGSRPASVGVLDVNAYADGLIMGTTRALTLGRGRSAVGLQIFYTPTPSPTPRTGGLEEGGGEGGAPRERGPEALHHHDHDHDSTPVAYSAEVTGERTWVALDVDSLRIVPTFYEFTIARDGAWCLFANNQLVICVMQAGADVVLDLRSELDWEGLQGEQGEQAGSSGSSYDAAGARDFDVTFHVELRSNMYVGGGGGGDGGGA